MMLPRRTQPNAPVVCPGCLGSGETLDRPIPAFVDNGAMLITWADLVDPKIIKCARCAGSGFVRTPAEPTQSSSEAGIGGLRK
jgi:hypothetical protein